MAVSPTIEALDPTKGRGFVERWMPLLVAIATLIVAVCSIFGLIEAMPPEAGLSLLLGTGGGIAIRSQG